MTTEHFSSPEREAREMIEAYRAKQEWSAIRQCLLMALRASWSSACTPKQWNRIASALANCVSDLPEEEFQQELTRAVRAKLLRTRANGGGTRLYELNLKG